MTKHYKNEQMMKFLTILGALVGLVWIISGFVGLLGIGSGFVPIIIPAIAPLDLLFTLIIGLVIVIITLLVGLKAKPLPFHWLTLFVLGILLVIFAAGIWACVLVIVAALIGLIESV
jgi:hypothetical protein